MFQSNIGSLIGSGDFIVVSVMMRRDFNRAAFTIACAAMKVTATSGNMFV